MNPKLCWNPKQLASLQTSALTHASARSQAAIYSAFFAEGTQELSADTLDKVMGDEIECLDGMLGELDSFTAGGLGNFEAMTRKNSTGR